MYGLMIVIPNILPKCLLLITSACLCLMFVFDVRLSLLGAIVRLFGAAFMLLECLTCMKGEILARQLSQV